MDQQQDLQEKVHSAIEHKQPLKIEGGNSKAFYGNAVRSDQILSTLAHTGIINYEPSEGFIMARCGTPLAEIEQTLADQQQMLAFEPPQFAQATIGGVIATGLNGPARPWQGSVRNHILGVTIITGQGKVATFFNQHLKQAGHYDVPRLMTSSQGTLGLLLDVTLSVVPKPTTTLTLILETDLDDAINYSHEINKRSLPLSGLCYYEDCLYIRLSGEEDIIRKAVTQLRGDELPEADEFWAALRNQTHEFFQQQDRPLWRLSIRPSTQTLGRLEGHALIEWGGAQHWLYSHVPHNIIRNIAIKNGGHATLYHGHSINVNPFHILHPVQHQLQIRLKQALDPHGIFNPGRLYPSI